MIEIAVVAGLAGLWVWSVLNDEDGILKHVNQTLQKRPLTNKWMSCPWCSGAWFSIAFSLTLFHPLAPAALVVALSAAAVCGILGSYISGE